MDELDRGFQNSRVVSSKKDGQVPKSPKFLRRIRKARPLGRSSLNRKDVTRAEYNHIIDTLNERAAILNEFRDAINALKQNSDIQFKRIAQLQADFDQIKQAWTRTKIS
jgi:hypothetical protein